MFNVYIRADAPCIRTIMGCRVRIPVHVSSVRRVRIAKVKVTVSLQDCVMLDGSAAEELTRPDH